MVSQYCEVWETPVCYKDVHVAFRKTFTARIALAGASKAFSLKPSRSRRDLIKSFASGGFFATVVLSLIMKMWLSIESICFVRSKMSAG